MLRSLSPLFCALCLLPAGCGEMAPPPPIETTLTDTALTLVTETFSVPPGDSFECFYTSYTTDRELTVLKSFGRQGPGGHHITVYYTTLPKPPGHHPCTDEEMVEWHQIAGSAGDDLPGGEGSVGLPDGLAIRVPAGVQIVAQMHYINTTGKPYDVQDRVTLELADKAKLKAYANYLVLVDGIFQVPSGMRQDRTSICTVPQDFQIVLMLGHMHELGQHYKLERIDETGQVLETLVDHPWQPVYTSHPPTKNFTVDKPYLLSKGTRLRQSCRWDNTSNEDVRFPREMCVSFMYYFPDDGEIECALSDYTTDGK